METQNRFKANVTSYIDTMHEKFTSKTLKADSKISEIRAALTDECAKKREYKQHTIDKVKSKNEEIYTIRKNEMIDKNHKIDNHIERKLKEFEAERRQKQAEAEIKQKHRSEVKDKFEQEFSEKINKVSDKLERIDEKAQKFIEKKEKERLIGIEMEAIKRREKGEEAKRIARQKEYELQKASEEKEKEQLKAAYLLQKRNEIKELRKTVKLNSKLYKEKLREEIETLKRYRKLSPDNIEINPDPTVPDRVLITHTSFPSKKLLAIEHVSSKKRLAPSGD